MSNLDDFWGTPDKKEEIVVVQQPAPEDETDLDINSPCPVCFRSDNTVSGRGKEIDQIDVFCKSCGLGYSFNYPQIWRMLGL